MENLTPEHAKTPEKSQDYYAWIALAFFVGSLGKGLNEAMELKEKADLWRSEAAESRKLTEQLDQIGKKEGVDILGTLQIVQLDGQRKWAMNTLDSEEVRGKLSEEQIREVKQAIELAVDKEKQEIKLNFSEKK